MFLTLVLVAVVVVMVLGAMNYHRWDAGPPWGRNALYLLAVLLLVYVIFGLFYPFGAVP